MKDYELTPREQDILMLLSRGLSNREIADKLVLSVGTVKWYNKQIFSKLGISSRAQAIIRARELTLLLSNASQAIKAIPPLHHNLPTQLTSFVGRKQELAELESLLKTTRLLTITGLGGIGKTRLAQEFARSQLDGFSDGIYFASLASAMDIENVVFVVAEALQFQFQRGVEPLQQLAQHIHQKRMLLILDNFEHLVDGADIVAHLLHITESTKMIVTSREKLNLYGEVIYSVEGLDVYPNVNRQHDYSAEAVDLFVKRAAATLPKLHLSARDLDHVVRICKLVEGMPLAIELAAAWVDSLSLAEIADEIEQGADILQSYAQDIQYGHNSMRTTFLRSWNLLDDPQQVAFRRISVFRGGFNREAVREIADIHYPTLKALVAKSLLNFDPLQHRYSVHALLQHFASKKLEEAGETQRMEARQALYFAAFANRKWEETKGNRQYDALLKLEADIENIRLAWAYWVRVTNIQQLKKLFHGVWLIYDIRGWHPAGIRLFQQTIEALQPLSGVDAQVSLGWLIAVKGLFVVARAPASRQGFTLCLDGVAMLRDLGAKDDMLIPLLGLFRTALQVGETEIALQTAQECLEVAERSGDPWAIAKANHVLALIAINAAEYDRAEMLAQAALAICLSRQDRWSEGMLCIEVLAAIAILRQKFRQAHQWLEQGLEAVASVNFIYAVRTAYFQLGYISFLKNDHATAASYWNKAVALGDHMVGTLVTPGFFGKAIAGDYKVDLSRSSNITRSGK